MINVLKSKLGKDTLTEQDRISRTDLYQMFKTENEEYIKYYNKKQRPAFGARPPVPTQSATEPTQADAFYRKMMDKMNQINRVKHNIENASKMLSQIELQKKDIDNKIAQFKQNKELLEHTLNSPNPPPVPYTDAYSKLIRTVVERRPEITAVQNQMLPVGAEGTPSTNAVQAATQASSIH